MEALDSIVGPVGAFLCREQGRLKPFRMEAMSQARHLVLRGTVAVVLRARTFCLSTQALG